MPAVEVSRPPSGSLWVHEIKHDGYRLMVRRDASRILRCLTRNGNDWADRFPSIVEAAARLEAHSFLIDGEAVIARDDGTPDFHALRSKRRGPEAVLVCLRPVAARRCRPVQLAADRAQAAGSARLLGWASGKPSISMSMWQDDGPTVFRHVCRMGLEGIVSKRIDAPYRSGPSRTWLKSKNPASEAVRREREEDWRR